MLSEKSHLRARGALAFLVAFSPLIAAVIVNGPSLQLYAAFGSGCLFSVAALGYIQAAKPDMPQFPPEPDNDGEAGPLGF